ncbi:MAG: rhodanese-like domain-containing protein [Phycisphaerales bacterium]
MSIPPPGASSSPTPAPALDERGLPLGYAFKPDWEVTPRETARLMALPEDQRPILVDCRRPDEWAFCKIAGAVHIPMDQTVARVDELEDDPRGKEAPIIVQCRSGVRSMTVTATLRGLGFRNVKSMAGGILAWSLSVDPTIPRY